MAQTILYLKILMFIASADDTITEDEYDCFTNLAIENGLSEETVTNIKEEIISGDIDISMVLSELTDDRLKKQLINDLILICYSDGHYSITEQNGIKDICNALGITKKQLAQIEAEAKMSNVAHRTAKTIVGVLSNGAAGTAKVGKMALIGGKKLIHSLANGINTVGAKVRFSLESAKKAKEENETLREQLKKTTLTEAIKQKIIIQLNAKIANLIEQLQEEKKRNKKNEEMIRELQSQIDDLRATLEVAKDVKTA